MKKKILIVSNHSFMLYQFRREVIAELLKKNEICISVPFGEHIDDFRKMGCRVKDIVLERRGINPFSDLKLLMDYHRLLKREKPDKVITYSIKPNLYAGYLCRRMKIPYYVNVQGLGTAFQSPCFARIASIMYRKALKKAATVFFENQGNADYFTERNIAKKSQAVVLPGAGINLERYTYQPYIEEGSVHFLYLGRIMKEKGMDEFFYAVEKIKNQYGEKAVFDVVGFFEDEYKEQVERLQKEGTIRFHGFQEDPRSFYGKANCVILPSYHEGMSNVLLEAAATGRALITSDICGCKEAVIPGVSGYLCKVKDKEAVWKAAQEFMELGKEKREQMGCAGRRHVEEKFDKKMVVGMVLEALGEC